MLQEALLRAWQAAPHCRPDGRPNGLLRLCQTAARNLAISELRRRRVDTVDVAGLLAEPAADPAAWRPPDPFLRSKIVDCHQRLPQQPRRALAARLDSASAAPDRELARMLGMQANTFLQNITRARKLMADCLRRAGIDLPMETA